MDWLTVVSDGTERRIPITPGLSVRDMLVKARLPVRSACRGNGACGLCLVQVEAGLVNERTRSERLVLSPEQRELNIRLACQLLPEGDLRVR
ncbi:MAG TPA: 2Fe-2S iron-sulfur cluster binding domain-containing protein, partial [Acidobacteriota bacterium]|nr:2Fe-2S iron-sulfur cluster binding domain-containing protein [Acidobacteriota bacterium]